MSEKSVINQAVEAVMDLIDALDNFALICRGPLGTNAGIACELSPSMTERVFLDKNAMIDLDLTLNGKHANLETLSDTMNRICDHLTRRKSYPDGNGWEIWDITGGSPPVPILIGRDESNQWMMAAGVIVKIYRKDETE